MRDDFIEHFVFCFAQFRRKKVFGLTLIKKRHFPSEVNSLHFIKETGNSLVLLIFPLQIYLPGKEP